jgi:hypothetical protein
MSGPGAIQFWGKSSVLSLSKDAGLASAACFDRLSMLVAPKMKCTQRAVSNKFGTEISLARPARR